MRNIFISILFAGLLSCQDWERMVELPNNNSTNSRRVVLLEDFTGASCPNCPAAAVQLELMLKKYPNNLVVVGVHSKLLSNPVNPTDFNMHTPEADAVETFLGNFFGKPEAAINRKKFDGKSNIRISKPDTWLSFVEQELAHEPLVSLTIKKHYNSGTRELKITLEVKALTDIDKTVHIHCGILESGIIADQASTTGKIKNYENNHVLRKLLSSPEGDFLASSMTKDQVINKSYAFTLPVHQQVWVVDNCSIFGFVSLDANEKYVLQAAETKVTK